MVWRSAFAPGGSTSATAGPAASLGGALAVALSRRGEDELAPHAVQVRRTLLGSRTALGKRAVGSGAQLCGEVFERVGQVSGRAHVPL